jgi:hypothetical protein
MLRSLLIALPLLLLATPVLAAPAAVDGPVVPAQRELHLIPLPPVPDGRLPVESMDEATMKTARQLNPFLKIAPLVIGVPLGVAGISIVASVPIALAANDPFAAGAMYRAGVGLMGGAFAAVLTFDILARTLRFFLDAGAWQKDIAFLAAGAGLAIGGYVMAAVGGQYAQLGVWPDGAVAGVLAGGATLWGVGLALMMIDTLRTAWKDNDPRITAVGRPGNLQFAGMYAVPADRGAVAGVVFRW